MVAANVSDYISDHTGWFIAALAAAILLLLLVVMVTQRRNKEEEEKLKAAGGAPGADSANSTSTSFNISLMATRALAVTARPAS